MQPRVEKGVEHKDGAGDVGQDIRGPCCTVDTERRRASDVISLRISVGMSTYIRKIALCAEGTDKMRTKNKKNQYLNIHKHGYPGAKAPLP